MKTIIFYKILARNFMSGVLVTILITPFIFCQPSQGGEPVSLIYSLSEPNEITMPEVNVDSLLAEDALNDSTLRWGFPHSVDIDFLREGTWDYLFDGSRACRLKLICPSAFAISLIYNEFYLPDESTFFVYDGNYETVLGAFTSMNNNSSNNFVTNVTKGESVILEYYEPYYPLRKDSKVNISTVTHDYRDIDNFSYILGEDYLGCPINAICEEVDPWRSEINGTVRLKRMDGLVAASAFLINNKNDDISKQYILTAGHCIPWDNDLSNYLIDFKYQSQTCSEYIPPTSYYSSNGLILKEKWAVDIALIEVTIQMPSNEQTSAHFLGWTISTDPLLRVSNPHHAAGWLKRVNYKLETYITGGYTWTVNPWDPGAVIYGASGSPLVNQDLYTVGVTTNATGNSIACFSGSYYENYALGSISRGLFSAWNLAGTYNNTTLKSYLDPENTGATFHYSIANYDINISNRTFDNPEDDLFSGFINTTGKITIDSINVLSTGVLTLWSQDEVIINEEFNSDFGAEFVAEAFNQSFSKILSPYVSVNISGRNNKVPKDFFMSQNFPNPFNPTTTIRYQLPVDSKVTIKLYDILGREVATLVNEDQDAGYKEVRFDASSLSSGIYIYNLIAGEYVSTMKMIVMK